MDSKGKHSQVLRDENWKCELVFLADITAHLNTLNLQLQVHDRMTTDVGDAVLPFHRCNLPHFPCCPIVLTQVSATLFPIAHFVFLCSMFIAATFIILTEVFIESKVF